MARRASMGGPAAAVVLLLSALLSGTARGSGASGADSLVVAGAAREASVMARVIAVLADYFDVPATDLGPDTDLVRDLGADPTDVAEALLGVFRAFGLPAPASVGDTTVGDIAAFVERARKTGVASTKPTGPDSLATVLVYYATNREIEDSGDPHHFYGGERARTGTGLHQGTCTVTVPVAVHRRGRLEGPGLPVLARWDAGKHIVLQSVDELEEKTFWRTLGEHLGTATEGAWSRDALLFVHGFNTSFDKAARRTAQMAYDMGFDGAPILFSWPSDGKLTRYVADREDAEWSAYALADFLETLAAQGELRQRHVIAHSMGNQVLVRALLEIARRRPPGAGPLLDNVILAAPDVDAELFQERLAPEILSLARTWTLYVSDKDVALDASAILSARRLGLPCPVIPGIQTVDATGVDVTPWCPPEFHEYYATKLRVLADLAGVLRGVPPSRRGLRAQGEGNTTTWALR